MTWDFMGALGTIDLTSIESAPVAWGMEISGSQWGGTLAAFGVHGNCFGLGLQVPPSTSTLGPGRPVIHWQLMGKGQRRGARRAVSGCKFCQWFVVKGKQPLMGEGQGRGGDRCAVSGCKFCRQWGVVKADKPWWPCVIESGYRRQEGCSGRFIRVCVKLVLKCKWFQIILVSQSVPGMACKACVAHVGSSVGSWKLKVGFWKLSIFPHLMRTTNDI